MSVCAAILDNVVGKEFENLYIKKKRIWKRLHWEEALQADIVNRVAFIYFYFIFE